MMINEKEITNLMKNTKKELLVQLNKQMLIRKKEAIIKETSDK